MREGMALCNIAAPFPLPLFTLRVMILPSKE